MYGEVCINWLHEGSGGACLVSVTLTGGSVRSRVWDSAGLDNNRCRIILLFLKVCDDSILNLEGEKGGGRERERQRERERERGGGGGGKRVRDLRYIPNGKKAPH